MSRYETLAPTLQQLVWQMTRTVRVPATRVPDRTVEKARRPRPGRKDRGALLDLHRQMEAQMERVVHMQRQIDRIVATLRLEQ